MGSNILMMALSTKAHVHSVMHYCTYGAIDVKVITQKCYWWCTFSLVSPMKYRIAGIFQGQ